MPYGVGIIGAGPGAWALHAPTVARLPDLFRVVHVADAGSGAAADLADPLAARASSDVAELLADARVEVVAVCSPPDRHAEHVRAAVAAGARGILCEKPLATDAAQAEAVIEMCRGAGVALVVGSHHLYDPAWQRAKHHLLASGGDVRDVHVTMSLPANSRYHPRSDDRARAAAGQPPAPDWTRPEVAASAVRRLVSGLLVHDLPLLRDLAPGAPEVDFARPLRPLGVTVGWRCGEVTLRSSAVMVGHGADALWRLGITTSRDRVEIDFPPSFVHRGSAGVRVYAADGAVVDYPRSATDGYEAEWRALAAMIDGGEPVEYEETLADTRYALALADAAAAEIVSAVAA